MPEDQAPRRNPQLGTDCPPWCRADHADQLGSACVGGGGSIGHIWTRAVRSRAGFEIGVTGLGPEEADESLHLGLDLREAGQLAAAGAARRHRPGPDPRAGRRDPKGRYRHHGRRPAMSARPDPFKVHVADQVLAALAEAAPARRCRPRPSRIAPATACATGSWSTRC